MYRSVVAHKVQDAMIVSGNSQDDQSFQDYLLKRQNILSFWERDQIESVPVSFGRFQRKMQELHGRVWELVTHREEYAAPKFDVVPAGRVLPNHSYVISSQDAGYSATLGLSFEAVEDSIETPRYPRDQGERKKYQNEFQTWVEHCAAVYENADRLVTCYMPFIESAADSIPSEEADFAAKIASLIRVAALFHDIGKLNMAWQRGIRDGSWDGEGNFWGKSRDNGKKTLPPHAFYALPVLRHLFHRLGVVNEEAKVDRLAELMALASARHHSLGSLEGQLGWDSFEPHPDLDKLVTVIQELLTTALKDEAALFGDIDFRSLIENIQGKEYAQPTEHTQFSYTLDTPSPSENYYPFYVLASRIIKVADWEASGHRKVELWH